MISMLDLPAQYRRLKPELDAAIQRVLESGQFVLGEEVASFESEFAAYCGSRFAVAVNSGTSALHLALLAIGVGPGDEVITVPLTFVATVAAILYTGAKPVLVDVTPATLTLDPDQFEKAVTPRTKAVVPVHLYGQPADMEPILDIACRRHVTVVEDAAHAHGARYRGQAVGSIGELTCFSFYPGKILGAYGEGGCVTTNNPDIVHKLRLLRDWGCERRYHHELRGYNYRMDALQAAVLRVKLRHLDAEIQRRRENATQYRCLLAGTRARMCTPAEDRSHVYHVFGIHAPRRNDLQRQLAERGIQTSIHYPVPIHLQPAYSDLGYKIDDFPEAKRAAGEELSLPIHPELTSSQVEMIAESVKRHLSLVR